LVEVQDQGKGIPLEKQLELNSPGRTGVGFRGMRERLRQLGGTWTFGRMARALQ